MRHGQSQWNLQGRFTGWKDVELSELGIEEAKSAGKILKNEGYNFDFAFSSYLKRAIHTLHFALSEMDLIWIPIEKSWRLNERHYGALQGLNKQETREKYGEDQVFQWRRGYETLPPLMEEKNNDHPLHDSKYKNIAKNLLPSGESLALCKQRVLPFWQESIVPRITEGKQILIAAHGNSIRSLVQHIENLNSEEITEVEIPTGTPLIYELNEDLTLMKKYFLK
jgi:2,3-bisphosphoglycerate-dependent phosphoglycerate mutase